MLCFSACKSRKAPTACSMTLGWSSLCDSLHLLYLLSLRLRSRDRGCGHLTQRLQPNVGDLPQRVGRPREMHVLLAEARKKLNCGPFEAQDYWPWGKAAQRATQVLASENGTCGGRQVDTSLALRGSFSPDSNRTHTGSASAERLTHLFLLCHPPPVPSAFQGVEMGAV